ncbi:Trafficking protein particle complex subunit 13 [Cytospora mali]|uniref:Trafficking protein particle complex subunit 13 n=1 Tax=Cytospora mali TaxID=578113 RepID=A0A194V287_CYTMA|nr:Trafficking protein particle complex subunit 13 [Valsa mali var. pyri (nom. inval.)]
MSHQRYASHDPVKEPHSISLKVLRLSRPSLVAQHPFPHKATPTTTTTTTTPRQPPISASLAYTTTHDTNPTPFLLSPILNLPPSFGSAYRKYIRDVRIEAEMKTPASQSVTKLPLSPAPAPDADGVDLDPGRTLQRIVNFDLKEEGNHVLGVTVSYYEATDTSGRTRTFRKLYQFVCKPSLIVRTKASPLVATTTQEEAVAVTVAGGEKGGRGRGRRRRWVLEAQLENCSEDTTELERVVLELEPGLSYRDCNWEASGSPKPVLHPGEVEQVCFVIEETEDGGVEEQDGKIMFGVMCIAWRSEMGQKGYLATNKLGTRHV